MSQRYFANNLFKIDYQVLDSKIFLNFIWVKEEMAKIDSNVIFYEPFVSIRKQFLALG